MINRFLEKVDKGVDKNGCWMWKAAKDKAGYGFFWFETAMRRSHRVSYILFVGEIPDGMDVLHSCDNPSCVNPKHLSVGTHQENLIQAASRFRIGGQKLYPEDVLQIRQGFEEGKRKADLAREYDVNFVTIHDIVEERTWKHLKS